MCNKNFFFFLFILGIFTKHLSAGNEDTVFVRSHDKEHWGWYGSIDKWTIFPDSNQQYRKIILKYTLGCPNGGCSDWDYTTQIFASKKTGLIDSQLIRYPHFTINGQSPDTAYFNTHLTYTTFFNTTTHSTDSTANPALLVVVHADTIHPADTTHIFNAFKGHYYNRIYNSSGHIIDSVFVNADSTWYNKFYNRFVHFPQMNKIEIGRMMTPYGGNFNYGWTSVYYFDITDYAKMLNDSVLICAFYSGWSDGYTVTLDFEMIKGIPPRNVLKVEKLWDGYFYYGKPNSIENYLVSRNVNIPSTAVNSMVRIYPSGHGSDNGYCSEFCSKKYFLKVNGVQRYEQSIWRNDCGLNPLWPQPGTWIYDRAGWCPGTKTISYDHEITPFVTPGSLDSIDLNMEPYVSVGGDAGYQITGTFFTYTAPNYSDDATLEDIISPNSRFDLNRLNPVCEEPRIIVKNTGSTALTSLKIKYGCVGNTLLSYDWYGNLGFLQSQEVILPNPLGYSFWNGNRFIAYVEHPNGVADQQPYNDTLYSDFNVAPTYGNKICIVIKTNNLPQENSWFLFNQSGDTLLKRTQLLANRYYRDTLILTPGCYQFEINDLGCDGLSWWANPGQGSGTIAFVKVAPELGVIKSFNADFGCKIVHNFNVIDNSSLGSDLNKNSFMVFPNPSKGDFTLIFNTVNTINAELFVYNMLGKVVCSKKIRIQDNFIYQLSMEDEMPGIYILKVCTPSENFIKQLIKN